MRGQLLVVLLLPFIVTQAGAVTTDCEANQFVVAMAAQRALEEMAFSPQASFAENDLSIQTEPKIFAETDAGRYAAALPPPEIRGRILVLIHAGGRDRSSYELKVTLEKHSDDDTWIEIESSGALEKELNGSIRYFIERYRKAASLN